MKSFRRLSRLMLSSQKSRDTESKLTPAGGMAQDSHSMTRGMQELRDMASRYQGLVTVSAQLVASAYEFSGAVQNLGSYCVKHFGSLENDDIGNIFETVGKVQFEISKSLDLYGSHVSRTIVVPTESLLSELRHLEDTKRQYDAKRQACDDAIYNTTKGKIRNSKGEEYIERQLKQAREDCEELAVFIGCRLLSLEHGRPRSLITQAARHYTAQVQLFSDVLEVLQGIERYMKDVMQERNIDERLNSAASAVSVTRNEGPLLGSLRQEDPTNLQINLKPASANILVNALSAPTDVLSTLGGYKGTGASHVDVNDNEGIEKDAALWLQEGNTLMAPTSPAEYQVDDMVDETALSFGPPSRRPPTIPILDVDDILVSKLSTSAIDVSDLGDIPSDGRDEVPSILTVEEALNRWPRGSIEEAATLLPLEPVGQAGAAFQRLTVGTTTVPLPIVRVGVPLFSSPYAAEARTNQGSSCRPLPEAAAIRSYTQAGPETAASRRYSQSGPLTSSGTPWPMASKATNAAGRLGKDPPIFLGPARSPRVSKLQISELHKLPAPPRATTTAATPSHASGGRGLSTRSGPLFRSHEDIGPARGRGSAQQQLLAAAAAQGRGAVPRSLSLPSSAQTVRKFVPHTEEQQNVLRKPTRPARKENPPSPAPI